jgi:L-asparaginase II
MRRVEPEMIVVSRRGGQTESEHTVCAALCSADGAIIAQVGDDFATTWRSGAKPFQLEASLSLLPADLVDSLDDADLAVGAASHSAEPTHTERVEALLGRFGAGEADLRCGAHPPVHEDSAHALIRAGLAPSQLHNNCSGKHTFMVAALRQMGWDSDYRPPEHPLQQHIRAVVDSRTGGRVQTVVVDGCGVPCFVAPLSGMATAFARLARATRLGDGLLGRIGAAMVRHPELVSGSRRLDLAVVQGASEPVISKVGAEALLCMALPRRDLGLVLKVRSGDDDARAVAAAALLERWAPGLLAPSTLERWHEVRNVVGRVVGRREALPPA